MWRNELRLKESTQSAVESRFPGAITVSDVASVDKEMVMQWSQRVSGLSASRKGALRDERSALFIHVDRIRSLVKQAFPWAQVRSLVENVASMLECDEELMSLSFGCRPWYIDASHVSLARRPRFCWIDWELEESAGVEKYTTPGGKQSVKLIADLDPSRYLESGWKKTSPEPFPTFTTSRPRESPGYKPAGII